MKKQHDAYKTWVEVDAAALWHNIESIKKHIGRRTAIMAIIKANAYGHGLKEVALLLKKEKNIWCGVDSLDEALMLKKIGVRHPIMILGYIPLDRLEEALEKNFHISIYSAPVLESVIKILSKNKKIKPHLHLKIETGTNRLGITLCELTSIKMFPLVDGIYTHFADVENPKSQFYQEQLLVFRKALWILKQKNILPSYIHAASSAALIQYPESHFFLVRLGIALYGLWPADEVRRHSNMQLHPVLQWKTRIAQIKEVQKGESVGYDRAWRAIRKSKIAILPVGYYDGYDRRLSHRGAVLIRGKRAPIVGRICMNMMIVDVTDVAARVGDEVVLIGRSGSQEISADEIAKQAGTINYEIVSRINPLTPHKIV